MFFRDLTANHVNNLTLDFLTEMILLGISFSALTGLNKDKAKYLGIQVKTTEKEFDIEQKKKARARSLWRKLALHVNKNKGKLGLVSKMAKKNKESKIKAHKKL